MTTSSGARTCWAARNVKARLMGVSGRETPSSAGAAARTETSARAVRGGRRTARLGRGSMPWESYEKESENDHPLRWHVDLTRPGRRSFHHQALQERYCGQIVD